MQPEHPTSDPEFTQGSTAKAEGPAVPGASTRSVVWFWALAGGLIAGLAAWQGAEWNYHRFLPQTVRPPNWNKMNIYERADYTSNELLRKVPPAETKNTALANSILGAALGFALGLAGGLARRSPRAGLLAASAGGLLAAVAGAGVSALTVPLFYKYVDPETGPLVPLLTHLAMFTVLGGVAGLALGLGLGSAGSAGRCVMGGMLGGAIGSFLFEVIIAFVYPLMRLQEPIPTEATPRFLIYLCVATFTALCVAVTCPLPNRPPSPQPSPT
jgi:hypothetical protein